MNNQKPLEELLVELSNGERGIRTGVKVSAKAVNRDEPVIEFVASDETLDRAGEIIRPEGWLLENYRANPVFQNSHQYGDIIFTIGKTEQIEVRKNPFGSYLYQRVRFAVNENPFAKIAYELYYGGFLNAVSVGFRPIKWVEGEKASPARRVYIEQELIEISAVSIPANQNALAIGVKSGRIDRKSLEESFERINGLINAYKMILTGQLYRNGEARKPATNTVRLRTELLRLRACFSALKGALKEINNAGK